MTNWQTYLLGVLTPLIVGGLLYFARVSRDKHTATDTRRREAERDKRLRDEKTADGKNVRDEQSRTNFIGFICELRAQVDKIESHRFEAWFSSMQIEVEKQCALVESAISWHLRSRFVAARKECAKTQTQRDLMDDRAPVTRLPVGLDTLPDITYQRGRKRAGDILDGLLDVCK